MDYYPGEFFQMEQGVRKRSIILRLKGVGVLVSILGFATLQYAVNGSPGRGWWEHVYFSGITFASIGYGDLVPAEPIPRVLAVLEGVLGVTFLGMLIASATKKIMNR